MLLRCLRSIMRLLMLFFFRYAAAFLSLFRCYASFFFFFDAAFRTSMPFYDFSRLSLLPSPSHAFRHMLALQPPERFQYTRYASLPFRFRHRLPPPPPLFAARREVGV